MKVEQRPVGRPVRVVFSIDNMDVGGTELNAVRTAERLDPARYDVRVVCLGDARGPLAARYSAAGIEIHRLGLNRLYDFGAVQGLVRLVRLFRRMRPDIVHAHDIYSNQFTVPAARLAGVPGVIASRRWWWQGLPGPVRRIAHRTAYRFAHRALANAPSVARLLEAEEGVPAARIVVVPNFLDESAFEPPDAGERSDFYARHGIGDDDLVIGIVANLTPVKDHATLIAAARRLAELTATPFRVVLVGDGPCRNDLEAAVRAAGLTDRVVFAGRSAPGRNLHHHFSISVLTSRSEAFPNSVLEAMAAGRPVVATAVGAVADAVTAGESGVLIPPGDPEALAQALLRLAEDHDLRASLGARAQAVARENYSADRVMAELERVYASLLDSSSTGSRGIAERSLAGAGRS